MHPTDFENALIARLLALPPDQRSGVFESACLVHPPLRVQQAALLGAVDAPALTSLPPEQAAHALGFALAAETDDASGTWIGRYKLLQKIGEGGFGVVWMAEQHAPIRRHVAVKIIKIGMDTEEVIARFDAERQALALMEHPNIARVFDAGATDFGRPFFAMELVRGVAITRYCDEKRLPATARLELFIAVCQAVQHAHQKGVIHRDLKPSNILVTLHDGVPVPKIIDFGIAKATSGRLTEHTLFTQFHAFIGTPAYTSPEQMELSGLDVDTRSDIYSLGVLLYELLTGRPPFDAAALLQSGLEAMRRTIREIDPPRPSHRLSTLSAADRLTVAQQRGTEHAKLSLLVRGDLDSVVMHCLEKDRTRRYDTAAALALDVRRHLDSEPVAARPPSASYRLRKLVRRHRVGFAAGAAVLLSLIAGLVASSLLLVRERSARREAEASAIQARIAGEKSAHVARFMKDILSGVGPARARGRDTAMLRETLDGTAQRLETDLKDQPEIAADLRETLGVVYHDLGQYAVAESLLRAAVQVHRMQFGAESPELATSLDHLGGVLRHLPNQQVEAESVLQEALAIRRRLFGPRHPLFADTLLQLSWVRNPQRSQADAEAIAREVLAIRRETLPAGHPKIAEALSRLALIAQDNHDHEKGVELHTEALTLLRRAHGEDHPAVAHALDRLGSSLAHLGRKVEARSAYREAFIACRKVLGDAHPRTTAALVLFVGQTPAAFADEGALQLLREFIAHQRQFLPAGRATLAPSLLAFASLIDGPERNPAVARAAREEAHALLEKSRVHGPPLDPEIIDAMARFGWWKLANQVPAEARAMNEEALACVRAAHGATSHGMVLPTRTLAWLYFCLRRTDDAIAHFEDAVRVNRAVLGLWHNFTGMEIAGLGAAYREVGRSEDSRRVLEEILAAWRHDSTAKRPPPPTIAAVLCELGLTLNRTRQFAEAERVLREALRCYEDPALPALARNLRPRARAASGLGVALAGQEKFAEAEPIVVQAFEKLQVDRDLLSGDVIGMLHEARDAVIALYTAWGKSDKAAEYAAKLPALTPRP